MANQTDTRGKDKAIWDDTKTGIFLGILIEEIDAGHRPSGHFTRIGWNNIINKFKSSTGCNFSQSQFKNKWDSLKKDFTLWERLRLEESGLGYDRETNRINADQHWWNLKIQEKPELKKFRHQGPIHLDLQEKVFRGIIATGAHEFRPFDDPFLQQGDHIEQLSDGIGTHNHNDDVYEAFTQINEERRTPTQKLNFMQRKRPRNGGSRVIAEQMTQNMAEIITQMKQDNASSAPESVRDTVMSYGESIGVLKQLPWMDMASKSFMNCLVLLEDRNKRISFSNIVDGGEAVVKQWIEVQMEMFNRK